MTVWQPSCDIPHLKARAQVLSEIRAYFAEKSVLEVETPLLGIATGTDPQLDFFETRLQGGNANYRSLYLQTSPEFAMKRLLAAGSGSIYQICKAFRNGEVGRLHNPEFTILEWYRVAFDLSQLMQDVIELMQRLFALFRPLTAVQKITYQDVFRECTGLDALEFDVDCYSAHARKHQLHDAVRLCGDSHNLWLDFIFSHCVQPFLGVNSLTLVYDYPACQAALAKLKQSDVKVAERVELFADGIELGNGFFELTEGEEQARRFSQEQAFRLQHNLPSAEIDHKFLAALDAGLPACAGIAIGLDRLLMVLNVDASLHDVLAFPMDRI